MRLSDLPVLSLENHGFQRRVSPRLLEEPGLKPPTSAPLRGNPSR